MKFLKLALLGLLTNVVTAGKSGKSKKDDHDIHKCDIPDFTLRPAPLMPYPVVGFKHYLVGLMTYSHDFVPANLQGFTTGRRVDGGPFQDIPAVGFTDISLIYNKVEVRDAKTLELLRVNFVPRRDEFYFLVDEGYGTSDRSDDFPLHYHHIKLALPMVYNHGDAKFGPYTEVDHQETILISDPDKLIGWHSEWDGHALDIQVAYFYPANWENVAGDDKDWKGRRVLTGRDLSPEGMAQVTDECSVVAEKWGPSIFAMETKTGKVKSHLIPVPNITPNITSKELNFHDFVSTRSSKIHCYLHEVLANECGIVDNKRLDENGYFVTERNAVTGKKEERFVTKYFKIQPDDGFVGLVDLNSNVFIGIFARQLPREPGVRIYAIDPGDCTKECPPEFIELVGFYKLSMGADRVIAISNMHVFPADTRILVAEHTNGFPTGKTFPRAAMPHDKLCILNLEVLPPSNLNRDLLLSQKICVLNYIHISDPYDVDGNGSGVHAQVQKSNGGLQVINAYCVIIATDPGYPISNNDFSLEREEVPFFIEAVEDTRVIMVCYHEPIFSPSYPHVGLLDQIGSPPS